ncbi:MAG: hypothetical protein V1744_06790 [Candidatus Altiarchaeota archaeon]
MRLLILAAVVLIASGCITTPPEPKLTTLESTSTTVVTPPPPSSTIDATSTTVSTSTTQSTSTTTTTIRKIEINEQASENCFGFVLGAPGETKAVKDLGMGWARPHPGPFAWGFVEKAKGNFDFTASDEWVTASQDNGVALLGTIWPYADWDQIRCHKRECEVTQEDIFYPRGKFGFVDGIPKSRCIPCNIGEYKGFMEKLVERYDGDGVEDMPGLKQPVKHWETLNEPALRAPDLTFFKGTPEEYVTILAATYESVKKACPDCTVVQGGAEGIQPEFINYWERVFKAGGGNYFDVANIHYINSGELDNLNVAKFKKLMDRNRLEKPIWVTEAEYRIESEVDASVDGALKAGASKVFFTRFIVGDRRPPTPGRYSQTYVQQAKKCK